MHTYHQLQETVAARLGILPSSVKTCWIAEVKRELGLTRGAAPNHGRGVGAPPCPERCRKAIREAILASETRR